MSEVCRATVGDAYPFLVSLLDICQVLIHAWLLTMQSGLGRGPVKGKAVGQHIGEDAHHTPSIMPYEVHWLGPPLFAVGQMHQGCQHMRSAKANSSMRKFKAIPYRGQTWSGPVHIMPDLQELSERPRQWIGSR